jgi:glycosyltransferase involved in cell wall biosynthesis
MAPPVALPPMSSPPAVTPSVSTESWAPEPEYLPAPSFAIVIPAGAGDQFGYPLLVSSLASTVYAAWEIVIVGASVAASTGAADGRRRFVESPSDSLGAAINAGIGATTADFVMIAGADGRLQDTDVRMLATRVPVGTDVVYCDERPDDPDSLVRLSKPDFSPERLRNQFYWGSAVFYHRDLLERLGGVRENLPGAELYDLALRAARSGAKVEHFAFAVLGVADVTRLPGALTGERAAESTRTALAEHLDATGGGVVDEIRESGIHSTHRLVQGNPLVSIVIPTRGGVGTIHGTEKCLVIEAVRGIVEKSTYTNYEIVIVMDDVADAAVVEELREIGGERLRLVWWDKPFNFSAKMNFGVYHSSGEYVLFLNDDTELISPQWIERMLALCQLPGAGMVGSMLYFEDDTIQHAGHLYDRGAGHIGTDAERGSLGPLGSFLVEREVSGVTAACSIMPKSIFTEVGGFSLLLPGNFNDVDLCMKVTRLGHEIYWTPDAELYHYESKTRISRVTRYEVETAWARWEWRLYDPSYWPYGQALTEQERTVV